MVKSYAVDLFCGIGGLTYGLQEAGIKVIAGIDIEEKCKYPYEYNTKTKFISKDLKKVQPEEINDLYPVDADIKILVGCAPCQPFSKYSHRYRENDNTINKMDLLDYFGKIVEEVQPEIVSMENVPQLAHERVFKDFLNLLEKNEYYVDWKVVFAPEYGVPQNRKRLVLLASKIGHIEFIQPKYNKNNYPTVKDTIGNLEPLKAGEVSNEDPLHKAAKLSEVNLQRIEQSKPGGSWLDWDETLLLKCHKKETGKGYKSVYGRMEWDQPSPTITTQFYGYGNGRFGHPEQNRAISLREGAMLQTFPQEYIFYDSDENNVTMRDIATTIGNAVPVKLANAIGESIKKALGEE